MSHVRQLANRAADEGRIEPRDAGASPLSDHPFEWAGGALIVLAMVVADLPGPAGAGARASARAAPGR